MIHPFMTSDNVCLECDTRDSLKFVDMRDDTYSQMLHVTKYVKCSKCGEKYLIKWINENGTMVPYYYRDSDLIDKFSDNIIRYAILNRRQL